MLNVAAMDSFPNLEGRDDSAQLISQAERALASLRTWTERHQALIDQHEQYAQDVAAAAAKAATSRAFLASIQTLREHFLAMHADASNPQARGRSFEGFLNELFGLFDLTPRAAYSLEREQIDGAFSFHTDDYILEARTQSFLGARYRRLTKRMPKKKALVATGNSVLTIMYFLLSDPEARYTDLGADYYETRMHVRRQARSHIRSLERLGYKVVIQAINSDTGELLAAAS